MKILLFQNCLGAQVKEGAILILGMFLSRLTIWQLHGWWDLLGQLAILDARFAADRHPLSRGSECL